jgi:protease-4
MQHPVNRSSTLSLSRHGYLLSLLIPSVVQAQDTADRPSLPSWSIAADDGAASTWSNPANLGLDPDSSWMILAGRAVTTSSPTQFAAIQNQGPLATGIIYRNGPDLSSWTTLSTGLGLPIDRNLSLGVHLGWQLPEGSENNFVSWDLGMSWRPLPWLGVSSVARNVGIKDSSVLDLRTEYGGGLGLRPWEDRIFFGVDALWAETGDGFSEPMPRIQGSLRLQLVDWIQVRVSGDTEGGVAAGLQFFKGEAGLGAHGALSSSDATPEALVYASSYPSERSKLSGDDDVIAFDLDSSYPYQASSGFFGARSETYFHLLERMRSAVAEPDTPAIFLRLDSPSFSMAQIMEIQELIREAQAQGKMVVAYIDGSGSNATYMLASAADKVFMHPAGTLNFVGLSIERFFFRETFDMFGVEPQFARRSEYKSGPEQYTESGSSAPNKEQMEALLDDLSHALLSSVAEGRSKELAEVRELVDEGPFVAREALEAGLVDGLIYPEELDSLDMLVAEGLPDDYDIEDDYGARDDTPGWKGRKAIAVVYVVGAIMPGSSQAPPLFGGSVQAGSDTIVRQLEQARKDDDVEAVIIRVDSPGGSAFASDEIWYAIERLKKEGKPVVVSMGSVAASGGYYVSAGADAIFALPTTVTGSIGVYSGKFSASNLFGSLGIRTETYARGRKAAMWTTSRPWDDVELAAVQSGIDEVYRQFKEKVIEGRSMEPEAVEQVARGRVWSGSDAQHLGLVDEMGGFYDAIEKAKELAELADERQVTLVTYSNIPGSDGSLRQTLLQFSLSRAVLPSLPPEIEQLYMLHQLSDQHTWAYMPYHLEIH